MIPIRRARRAAVLAFGLILAGCATATSPDEMSITADAAPRPVPGGRADHGFRMGAVTGGAETEAIGLSDVSNTALSSALTTSLGRLGYLADDPSKAAYVISADLVDLDRPVAALDPALLLVPIDLSVTVRIRYSITRASGGPPVLEELVATTGTGRGGEAATPAGRVRKADEDAVRLNTAAFLRRLQTDWK